MSLNLSNAISIKHRLEDSLAQLGEIKECVLLNYPDYPNVGDHLIGLGTIIYLLKHRQVKINYLSAIGNHSSDLMDSKLGEATILLQGGGNLGDLWYEQQTFREEIIQQYPRQRIIILPQTIHFQDPEKLSQAAKIFNHHPDLTILVRDHYSYDLAITHFNGCKILLCPDMAFMLADLPGLRFFRANWQRKHKILYHCRDDQEIVAELSSQVLQIPNLIVEDWLPPDNYLERSQITTASPWYWRLPGTVRLYREVWQHRLSRTMGWLSKEIWDNNHPYNSILATVDNPAMVQISWDYLHRSIYQLNPYPVIITNRLHGHILCILLEIPHIFLPNSYGKNQNWHETWTKEISFCHYADNSLAITQALQELCPKYL